MEFGIIRGLLVLSSAIALLPSFKPAESDTEDTLALITRWEQDASYGRRPRGRRYFLSEGSCRGLERRDEQW